MKSIPIVAACLSMLGCIDAQARVIDSRANGFTIENVITVPVDADDAWKALIKDVDKWWPKSHSWFGAEGKFRIDPHAGGCFCEIAGKRESLHMTVTYVDPGHLLRMVGGLGPLQGLGLHGALEWRFKPIEGGTEITLYYVAGGYTTEDLMKFAPVVDKVQSIQLGGLETFLSKGRAPAESAK
jgi:uncharacterized protein YndB with AHSA1/START domain